MSNLPEVPVDKYAARYKALANNLQDQVYQVESLAEALLAERDAAVTRAEEAEKKLAELGAESNPDKGTEKKS